MLKVETIALDLPVVRRLPGLATYAVLAGWAALVLGLIAAGVYADAGEPPLALMATVASPLVAFAAAYRLVPGFRGYVLALDPTLVLGAQLWRVVGLAFLFALAFGELPADFAVPAGVGDVATGVAALAVIVALSRRTLTRGRLYAFTALGVGDFLMAIATGLALRPEALDLWPLIIFPTMMVPFFAVLHVIAVLQARGGRFDHAV